MVPFICHFSLCRITDNLKVVNNRKTISYQNDDATHLNIFKRPTTPLLLYYLCNRVFKALKYFQNIKMLPKSSISSKKSS